MTKIYNQPLKIQSYILIKIKILCYKKVLLNCIKINILKVTYQNQLMMMLQMKMMNLNFLMIKKMMIN